MTLTRRGKMVVVLVATLSLAGAVALGGYAYLRSIGVYGTSDPGGVVSITIPKGTGTGAVGDLLVDGGVIPSSLGWRIVVYLDGGDEEILAGTYELRKGLTAREALEALVDQGPTSDEFVTVTFPEGSWLSDFANILERDTHVSGEAFLRVLETGRVSSRYLPDGSTNFEGLLFPSTYQVIARDRALSVARRLAREFEEQADVAGVVKAAEDHELTPYEFVTVASMIEAESKVDEDRPRVARVIYNRIELGMKLEIDATVHYAIRERGKSLTNSDLQTDSPYNTRRYAGIPPGPIGAPGLESLEAAAHPAEGDWLYYVVIDCEGHHSFTSDYGSFLKDVARYRSLDCP